MGGRWCIRALCSLASYTCSALYVFCTLVSCSCSVLQCVAVCCSVLQFGAVWCSVAQCVAVCVVLHPGVWHASVTCHVQHETEMCHVSPCKVPHTHAAIIGKRLDPHPYTHTLSHTHTLTHAQLANNNNLALTRRYSLSLCLSLSHTHTHTHTHTHKQLAIGNELALTRDDYQRCLAMSKFVATSKFQASGPDNRKRRPSGMYVCVQIYVYAYVYMCIYRRMHTRSSTCSSTDKCVSIVSKSFLLRLF